MSIFLVALGGFFGSITRYYIYIKANQRLLGTWSANITGSVLLAFIFHFYSADLISEQLWLFLGVGFSGSYTTFSTFGNETLQLILAKEYKVAAYYVLSSLMVALFFVFIILHMLSF